jgi:hypothetical protein
MRKRGIVFTTICGLIGLALAMLGCNGFFVSPNSVGSISVSPTSALLLQGGTQQLTVNATLVNGNAGGDVTSSSTCSSNNSAAAAPASGSSCSTINAVGAGSAVITVSNNGATATVLFAVVAAPITQLTITSPPSGSALSATGITSGVPTSLQLVVVPNGQTTLNLASFVTWTTGSNLTVSSTGVLTASAVTLATTSNVYASLSSSAVDNNSAVQSNTVSITVDP